MDEFNELIAGLTELFEVEDEAFSYAKELMYESIAATLTGPVAEQTANTTVQQFKRNGYNRAKIHSELKQINELYYNLFVQLKANTDNEEKHEFADKMYSLFENYNHLILELYDAENPVVHVQLLREGAKLPTYANAGDRGADIYACEDVEIAPNSFGTIVKTGIAVAIPDGWALAIRPRSGMSSKTCVRVTLGTIDSGYKDEVGVIVDNFYSSPYSIHAGDRIAQFVLERNYTAVFEETDNVHNHGDDRNGGFGSTGQ